MPANTKPVPWNEIKRRYEAGQSANAIARDLTSQGRKISKQAILKRKDREGWQVKDSAGKVSDAATSWQLSGLPNTATGNQLQNGPSRSATQIANWGKRTPENAREILEKINLTGDWKLAARSVGIHPDTLKRWRESDPDFAAQIDSANAEFCLRQVSAIDQAGQRGDWKASDRLLQTNPLTKEDYAPDSAVGAGRGITLNFNISRGDIPQEAEIIEVEAQEIK